MKSRRLLTRSPRRRAQAKVGEEAERVGRLEIDDQFQPFEIMLMVQWVIQILALA
jgi:hypothetical protein